MLVDVVLLRHRGRKIDRDQVRAVAPIRGVLQVDKCGSIRTPEHRETPRIALLLKPGLPQSALPPLLFVRFGTMRDWQFVLIGQEEENTGRKYPPRHRQAWWCRVVLDSPGAPKATAVAVAMAGHERLAEMA